MAIPIEMPRLSDTMEEGTLVKWHVSVGDAVSSGDHLADVETDKATMELQAFDDGTVAKMSADEGQTVPVGEVILVLAEAGESVEDAAANAGAAKPASKAAAGGATGAPEPAAATAVAEAPPKPAGGDGRVRISPLARKLAEERGIDPATLTGSGPDGRIIKRDVLAAAPGAAAPPTTPAPSAPAATAPAPAPIPVAGLEARTVAVSGMRKTIARRLVESKTQVPHFQVSVAVNMDPLIELRQTLNAQLESQGVKLSINDFVTRAAALACVQHPDVNSSWMGDTIVYHGTVNVGVAVSLPAEKGGGLVVATVRDVQSKGLRQISADVKTLANKARTSGLSPQDMSDSTITISNLGMPQYGVTQFTAVINPPNAAILAIGAALQKPVVRDGQVVVGHEMNVTLSGDHRVIDGAIGAEYLAAFSRLLENPASLLV